MPTPPRSRDRLDDGHMTAEVHRRWGGARTPGRGSWPVVPPGQKLISYDVSALFTSIPVPDAIKAVRIKLDEDPKLQERTPLSRERILELLSFCLNTTYFTYRGVIYKQKHGAAMGSPVSPIIANLYMEGFEEIAQIRTAPTPPPLQYGSDTWTIHSP